VLCPSQEGQEHFRKINATVKEETSVTIAIFHALKANQVPSTLKGRGLLRA
jgi:hypothetical protein